MAGQQRKAVTHVPGFWSWKGSNSTVWMLALMAAGEL